MAAPISEVLIDVDRCAVDAAASTKAAIDVGCSLSKFVYLAKGAAPAGGSYAFRCALFRSEDFEAGLRFLRERAELPAAGKIGVTGAACAAQKQLVTEVLGLEAELADGLACNARGLHFLLSNATSPDDLFHPKVELPASNQRSPLLAALAQKMRDTLTANEGPAPQARFPCVLVTLGSAAVGQLVNPDGTGRLLGKNLTAGRSLLGLGRALVGSNSYEEIMALAGRGDVSSVDTTIGEFVKEDPNSAYGSFPHHLPLFSFGKMIDSDRPLDGFARADRALSLARLIAINLNMLAFTSASLAGVSQVIVGGGVARAEVMRRLIATTENLTRPNDLMDMKFLKIDHVRAFGAMVS